MNVRFTSFLTHLLTYLLSHIRSGLCCRRVPILIFIDERLTRSRHVALHRPKCVSIY